MNNSMTGVLVASELLLEPIAMNSNTATRIEPLDSRHIQAKAQRMPIKKTGKASQPVCSSSTSQKFSIASVSPSPIVVPIAMMVLGDTPVIRSWSLM